MDALVLGGDITGKTLVPLVADGEGWHGEMDGVPIEVGGDEQELAEVQERIRRHGRYDVLVTAEQKAEIDSDTTALRRAFDGAMADCLRRWVALAEERLEGSGIACFMMLGNDDAPELADIIRASDTVSYSEDGITELPGGYEMVSVGESTPTPWDTPRELSEEELLERIESQASQLERPRRAVFNLHCPPRDTKLDQAPMMDDKMRPVTGAGAGAFMSVGSRSVREVIEQQQPLLGLHGHVHESAAGIEIGPTICLNPGSEYQHGVLRGAIVQFSEEGIADWQLIHG